MKALLIFTFVVAVTLLALAAEDSKAQSCLVPQVQYQFVGVTTSTTNADVGLKTLTELCQAEVDPDSRMCTDVEIQKTIAWPVWSGNRAWVNGELTCGGWDSTGNLASSVSPIGGFSADDCFNDNRRVTCCAPIAVPEPPAAMLMGAGVVGLAYLGSR